MASVPPPPPLGPLSTRLSSFSSGNLLSVVLILFQTSTYWPLLSISSFVVGGVVVFEILVVVVVEDIAVFFVFEFHDC